MTDKERLEELKEWFNNDGEIHEFQIDWLIEQTEKVEKLKNAYYDENFLVTDYLRTSAEVFGDKTIASRKTRD